MAPEMPRTPACDEGMHPASMCQRVNVTSAATTIETIFPNEKLGRRKGWPWALRSPSTTHFRLVSKYPHPLVHQFAWELRHQLPRALSVQVENICAFHPRPSRANTVMEAVLLLAYRNRTSSRLHLAVQEVQRRQSPIQCSP